VTEARGRILVVDDDEAIRELIAIVLSDEGYGVQTARHGAEALDLIDLDPPDLILLDMRMPVMDGWQFSRTYRQRSSLRAPIVAHTAGRDSLDAAAQIAAADYLAKPFELERLLDVVARLIGQRAQRSP
jgi:two-component system chemotaxis response regulator CheY